MKMLRVYKGIAVLLCAAMLLGFAGVQPAQAAGSWVQVGDVPATNKGLSSLDLAMGRGIRGVCITTDSGVIYLSYSKYNMTYVKKLSGSKWVSLGQTVSGPKYKLHVSSKKPYLTSGSTIYRFDGTKWILLSSSGLPRDQIESYTYAVYNGVPYIAYAATASSKLAAGFYVMKHTGTKWVFVGGKIAAFKTGNIEEDLSMTFFNGTPYLSSTAGAFVKKYNGTSWISIAAVANGNDAALSASASALYATIRGGRASWASTGYFTLSVKKLSGSKWVQQATTLKASQGGILLPSGSSPFLVYDDKGIIRVKKLSANTWVTVGSGLTMASRGYPGACVVNGVPYVAYVNKNNDLIVRKYQ